jgi:hypothetical protein
MIKFILLFSFSLLTICNCFGQTENSDTTKTLKLIKKNKGSTKDSSETVFKSNSGFVKIYKLNDSLFLLKAYNSKIYLGRKSIKELQEAAKLMKEASKGDKVSLNTFRCDITKGKILGADTYWLQLYKQKTKVDISSLTLSEVYALTQTSNINSVKDNNGNSIVDKARIIEYEEMVEKFGITNKELNKLLEIK